MRGSDVLKTLIVSAFPGCGKSYLAQNCKIDNYTFCDKDNGYLDNEEQFKTYVSEILELVGKFDFILISQYPQILKMLYSLHIPYIVIAPNNISYLSTNTKQLIKQQWFGRFYLRKNSSEWINLIYNNYDKWTSLHHLKSMRPKKIILLNYNEYLSDIMLDLVKIRKLYGIDFVNYCKNNIANC